MVSKAVILLLFSSMLLSEESSGLSQRLNAIDAQEQEILSSFEQIKKEQEAKEEQSSQERMQNEENATLSPVVSPQEKTDMAPELELDSVDEVAQKEAREVTNEAEETHYSDTIDKSGEKNPQVPEQTKLSSQPIPQKPTAVKSKKSTKTKLYTKKMKKYPIKSIKKKQTIEPKAEPTAPVTIETIPTSEPTLKKRTALEHLDSVLKTK